MMQARLTTKPQHEVIAAIQALDLEPVKLRVMHPELGEGWTREYAESIEAAYRNYLVMLVKYPDHAEDILISKDVDEFWHTHILQTRKYMRDCQSVFGAYLHHEPHVGSVRAADLERRAIQAETTRKLHEQELRASNTKWESVGQAAYCAASIGRQDSAYCAASAQTEKKAYCAASIEAKNTAYCAASLKAEDTAYCAASIEPRRAAYCAAGIETGNTAYCAANLKAEDTAYCAASIEPRRAAYCAASIETGNAAYCAASLRAEDTAYCAASIDPHNVAYCAASVQAQNAAYCAASLNPDDKAYCAASVTRERDRTRSSDARAA